MNKYDALKETVKSVLLKILPHHQQKVEAISGSEKEIGETAKLEFELGLPPGSVEVMRRSEERAAKLGVNIPWLGP